MKLKMLINIILIIAISVAVHSQIINVEQTPSGIEWKKNINRAFYFGFSVIC